MNSYLVKLLLGVAAQIAASLCSCSMEALCTTEVLGSKYILNHASGKCYSFVMNYQVSWSNAWSACTRYAGTSGADGRIAWFTSEENYNDVKAAMYKVNISNVWIGAKEKDQLNSRFNNFWYSDAVTPVRPLGWAPDKLSGGLVKSDDSGKSCLSMKSLSNDAWHNEDCLSMQHFVCEFTCNVVDFSTEIYVPHSLTDYCSTMGGYTVGSSCYLLEAVGSAMKRDFTTALKVCMIYATYGLEGMEGRLGHFADVSALKSVVGAFLGRQLEYWIGIQDTVGKDNFYDHKWATGSCRNEKSLSVSSTFLEYTNFKDPSWRCVTVSKQVSPPITDADCTDEMGYLCEIVSTPCSILAQTTVGTVPVAPTALVAPTVTQTISTATSTTTPATSPTISLSAPTTPSSTSAAASTATSTSKTPTTTPTTSTATPTAAPTTSGAAQPTAPSTSTATPTTTPASTSIQPTTTPTTSMAATTATPTKSTATPTMIHSTSTTTPITPATTSMATPTSTPSTRMSSTIAKPITSTTLPTASTTTTTAPSTSTLAFTTTSTSTSPSPTTSPTSSVVTSIRTPTTSTATPTTPPRTSTSTATTSSTPTSTATTTSTSTSTATTTSTSTPSPTLTLTTSTVTSTTTHTAEPTISTAAPTTAPRTSTSTPTTTSTSTPPPIMTPTTSTVTSTSTPTAEPTTSTAVPTTSTAAPTTASRTSTSTPTTTSTSTPPPIMTPTTSAVTSTTTPTAEPTTSTAVPTTSTAAPTTAPRTSTSTPTTTSTSTPSPILTPPTPTVTSTTTPTTSITIPTTSSTTSTTAPTTSAVASTTTSTSTSFTRSPTTSTLTSTMTTTSTSGPTTSTAAPAGAPTTSTSTSTITSTSTSSPILTQITSTVSSTRNPTTSTSAPVTSTSGPIATSISSTAAYITTLATSTAVVNAAHTKSDAAATAPPTTSTTTSTITHIAATPASSASITTTSMNGYQSSCPILLIENGKLIDMQNFNPHGTTKHITCSQGYLPIETSTTCLNGQWSTVPVCKNERSWRCPTGRATLYTGTACYWLTSERQSWDATFGACIQLSGKLAPISSSDVWKERLLNFIRGIGLSKFWFNMKYADSDKPYQYEDPVTPLLKSPYFPYRSTLNDTLAGCKSINLKSDATEHEDCINRYRALCVRCGTQTKLGEKTTRNLRACAKACRAIENCLAINYFVSSRKCEFYNQKYYDNPGNAVASVPEEVLIGLRMY